MIKTYEITVDIENDLYTPSNLLFTVSNKDFETVELMINIKQDDVNMILDGTAVELAIKKPSGLTVYQETEIIDPAAGLVRVLLKNQAYLEDGVHTAEVYVRNEIQLAVSCPFFYFSRESIMNEVESVNEWSALQQALFAYDLKPVLVEGFPTLEPEYIGQMAFDTINKTTFFAADLTAESWQPLGSGEGGGGGGLAYWNQIIGKPEVFPADLTDPALTAALAEFITESEADSRYITGIPAELLTETEADLKYLTAIPAEYLTEAEADLKYLPAGTDVSPAWGEIGGLLANQADLTAALAAKADDSDLAAKADIDHTHAITDITGLQPALDSKADDNHTHGILDISGLQTALDSKMDDSEKAALLTETEGDVRYKAIGAPVDPHTHVIADITGLQPALDNKADDVDLEGYASYDFVYIKDEVYNKTEIDQLVMGEAGGSPVLVEDNLASTSTTNALSANQGRILNSTKASLNHTHTTAQITDFAAGVAANIPTEYLTESEAALLHAAKTHIHTVAEITDFAEGVAANIPAEYITTTEADGTYLKAVPAEYLTETEADLKYLTTIPAEYLTEAEGNAAYQPLGSYAPAGNYAPAVHTHTTAQITDFAAGVAANIPTEYLTETEGNALYAKTANVYSKTAVDTSLAGKADKATTLAGYGITDGASDQDLIDHAIYQNGELAKKQDKIWTGTQAAYDLLTPDPATIYFITG